MVGSGDNMMKMRRLFVAGSILSSMFSFIIILLTVYHNYTVKRMLKQLDEEKHI